LAGLRFTLKDEKDVVAMLTKIILLGKIIRSLKSDKTSRKGVNI
jgi:hypothetical protein